MGLSLAESQIINQIANLLYEYLPGKPHPFADQSISYKFVASKVGVGQFWSEGSKLPSITKLLTLTLENRRDRFCDLILEIVQTGLIYRNSKSNPINREEIQYLNELLTKVHFKIPELWKPDFLDSLPTTKQPVTPTPDETNIEQTMKLKDSLLELSKLSPQERGYAFEKFLNELFSINGLAPRKPFRLVGEQIDGSIQLGQDTYLVEAKWHNEQVGQSDLLVFYEKVHGKSTWSRGIFISNSGFTEDGITAYSRGRPTNMIGLTGQDLYFILEGKISLKNALEKKIRRATETGDFYVSVFDLLHQ